MINKVLKQKDLKFGLNSENMLKAQLETVYGDLIKLDKYNNFDFKGDKIYIELKTRKILHNQYPSLMFSKRNWIMAWRNI